MVSWIVACIAFSALTAGGLSFPIIEDHHELSIPETLVGHEEVLDHNIGFGQELHELEPKHATSYQSFHLESKHAAPVVIKTIHPTPIKHFGSFGGGLESFGHESFGHESFGHSISEIEPIGLKLHGI